jgi:hypothetical protein
MGNDLARDQALADELSHLAGRCRVFVSVARSGDYDRILEVAANLVLELDRFRVLELDHLPARATALDSLLASALDGARLLASALDTACLLASHRVARTLVLTHDRDNDSVLCYDFYRDLDSGMQYDGQAFDIGGSLDAASAVVCRWVEGQGSDLSLEATAEAHVLGCLARLLPAGERVRFVAEARGNLGDCVRWWQRVEDLVMLAIGTPRLAVMMRREGRRRSA